MIYQQIQAYPTCILYVQGGTPLRQDLGNVGLTLISVAALSSIDRSVSDSSNAGLSLLSVNVTFKIVQTQTDTGNAALSLKSCLVPTPVTQTQTDGGNAGLALVSVNSLAPVNAAAISEAVNTGLSLKSVSA